MTTGWLLLVWVSTLILYITLSPLPPPDPTQYCQDWSLEGGWLAEEGKFLLPPKVMER